MEAAPSLLGCECVHVCTLLVSHKETHEQGESNLARMGHNLELHRPEVHIGFSAKGTVTQNCALVGPDLAPDAVSWLAQRGRQCWSRVGGGLWPVGSW